MKHELPHLPFRADALEPWLSAETLEFHHGKHHKAYVDKLNELIEGTEFADQSLDEIVVDSEGEIFNNAAQAWNHSFFWNCLRPGKSVPHGAHVEEALKSFGGVDEFKKTFTEFGLKHFGSGWIWLIRNNTSGVLELVATVNADNPLTEGNAPILVCDLWEHAYYIDYRNQREKFLESFFDLINWEFVEKNLQESAEDAAGVWAH